ncbi:hypothetical protein ANCCAN_06187 [Ancylostoma caninum]|uniref:PiggyBac transposable element-derived protein domain-containing protein n=1 Tax=Ancylostoma caninum TaxID=29170 RepID=A0A368GTM9_ANCCA|nr:hypothetical protein ANCCAN_06187 [Ancylostoma caninum]
MIPFRGRVLLRQYLRGKQYEYGLKLCKLCSEDAGRQLVTDNFYTSIPLAGNLLHRGTFVGTLRKNRVEIPKDIISTKLRRGEVVARQNVSGITILK